MLLRQHQSFVFFYTIHGQIELTDKSSIVQFTFEFGKTFGTHSTKLQYKHQLIIRCTSNVFHYHNDHIIHVCWRFRLLMSRINCKRDLLLSLETGS